MFGLGRRYALNVSMHLARDGGDPKMTDLRDKSGRHVLAVPKSLR